MSYESKKLLANYFCQHIELEFKINNLRKQYIKAEEFSAYEEFMKIRSEDLKQIADKSSIYVYLKCRNSPLEIDLLVNRISKFGESVSYNDFKLALE